MKNDFVQDVFFIIGLAGVGAGVYDVFGRGWALLVVGFILCALSIYGSRET